MRCVLCLVAGGEATGRAEFSEALAGEVLDVIGSKVGVKNDGWASLDLDGLGSDEGGGKGSDDSHCV